MNGLRRQQLQNAAIVVVAVALAGAVFATRGSVTTGEQETRSSNVLAAFREEDITRVVIERGLERIVLERAKPGDGGEADFRLKAPYDEEADPFAVEKLLGTLQYASWVRRVNPEEVNRAAFGLDAPSLVIHVDMGEIHYRLRLGKQAASPKDAHYLEVTGEGAPRKGIVIVGKSLVDELGFKADDFRGRYIMPYLSPSLRLIVLEGSGGQRKLRRAEWDGWRFDGMLGNARLNRQALDRMLLQFARTVAEKFIGAGQAKQAQAGAETVTITQTPSDPKLPRGRVIIGGRCPNDEASIVALRAEPDSLAGCVPKNVMVGLTTAADALVDGSAFWMRADEVEHLEVVEGDKTLELDRKQEGFLMRKPRQADVDAEAGNARLEAMLRASGRIVEAPDLAALGLNEPRGRVTLKSAAADDSKVMVETVLVSAPVGQPARSAAPANEPVKDGKLYVLRKHDGVVIELSPEAARLLRADASLVKSRKIFDFGPLDIVDVDVEVRQRPYQHLKQLPKGGVELAWPKGFVADGTLASELVDAVRTLTADKWVSDADDGTFGLGQPTLTARFTVQKDQEQPHKHEIVVGRATASGFYASTKADPGVFVLPRRAHEVLSTLVIDRSPFMVDPAKATRITLETQDRVVTLEKHGDTFVQLNDGEQLSPAAIQQIIDALAVLRAEAAVEVGPPNAEHGLSEPLLRVRVEREAERRSDPSEPAMWRIGSGDSWRGITVHYARAEGVDATYVIARTGVQRLIDAL